MAIFAICKLEHYDGKSHTKVGEKRTDITFAHSHAFCYDFYEEQQPIVRPLVKVEAPAPVVEAVAAPAESVESKTKKPGKPTVADL